MLWSGSDRYCSAEDVRYITISDVNRIKMSLSTVFFIMATLLTRTTRGTPENFGREKLAGDEEVLKDRAALMDSTWDFPFSTNPIPKPLIRIPGAVGVSLGLGLPALQPSQSQHFRTIIPAVSSSGRELREPGRRPDCATNENYCLHTELYPLDKVNAIIDRFYNEVRHTYSDLYQFSDHDLVRFDNRTFSTRRGGHFVCESTVQFIRPGWAQNVQGEWVAVVNTDKFPQSVRIESCRHKEGRCEYLPPCYKSKCVQRYNYVKLLCLDPYKPTYRPTLEVIQVPAGCACYVEDFSYY